MKHLYVFGAGASAASASVPLGRDLVWNYHSDCGLLVPFDESGPDLREENDNFAHFTRFLKLAASIYPDLEGLPQKWENSGMRLFDLYRSVKKRHYIDEMLETLHQKGNTEGVELVRRLIFEHLTESSVGRKNLL